MIRPSPDTHGGGRPGLGSGVLKTRGIRAEHEPFEKDRRKDPKGQSHTDRKGQSHTQALTVARERRSFQTCTDVVGSPTQAKGEDDEEINRGSIVAFDSVSVPKRFRR